MKADLKVKYLQYLNQKKQDEGFTLIELLVVIIIIGILAAIALPSFLSQANKAKQSEAKTYVGSINNGQQAYYTEKGTFGTDISVLGIGIRTQTNNYAYYTSQAGTGGTGVSANSLAELTSQAPAAIKTYAGVVFLQLGGAASDATSVAIMCETSTPGTNSPITGNSAGVTACPTGSTPVGQ